VGCQDCDWVGMSPHTSNITSKLKPMVKRGCERKLLANGFFNCRRDCACGSRPTHRQDGMHLFLDCAAEASPTIDVQNEHIALSACHASR
jgi:hypothetical protein